VDQNVSFVTLGVADVAASRRFYTDGLGWVPAFEVGDFTCYQVGHGLLLSLFEIDEMTADVGHPTTPGNAFTLSQNVGSRAAVDAAVDAARGAGATVLKEPQLADFGGYHAYLADPDGHRWEIAFNPGWSVAADGTATLRPIEPGEV
jgi:catechol 2,3-dioxygenase-like lactoylglutathione lyase family enzyme